MTVLRCCSIAALLPQRWTRVWHRPSDNDGVLARKVAAIDRAANGLLDEADSPVCWLRSVVTLAASKNDIAGLTVATDERIEACLLYVRHSQDQQEDACSVGASAPTTAAGVRIRGLLRFARFSPRG